MHIGEFIYLLLFVLTVSASAQQKNLKTFFFHHFLKLYSRANTWALTEEKWIYPTTHCFQSGLYFSSGIIAISMFGNLIWATKLAKYLRKMEDPDASEKEYDDMFGNEPESHATASSNGRLGTPPPNAEGWVK